MAKDSTNSRPLTYTEYLHSRWIFGILYVTQLFVPIFIVYNGWQKETLFTLPMFVAVGVILLSFFQLNTLTPQYYEKLVYNDDPWVYTAIRDVETPHQ